MSLIRVTRFRCQQAIISLLTAVLTIIVSNVALAAPGYQLTVPQRLSLNPNNGHGLAGITPRSNSRARSKTIKSSQSANPKLVGQQLYQALTQNSTSTTGLKLSKTVAVRSGGIISDAQQQNLQSLNNQLRDSGGVKVVFDTGKGTPTFIKPNKVSIKPKFNGLTAVKPTKAAIAKQFLSDNRALLKLENPESELLQVSQTTDSRNNTHIRFQQTINNIPVWGKQALVHLDRDNGVYLFQGRYEPTLSNVSTNVNITEQTAVDKVLHDLNFTGELSEPAQVELVFYTTEAGSAVLSYKVELLPSLNDRWIYFINAVTGTVVHKIHNIHKNVVQASGNGIDNITRTFNVWDAQNGVFYLIDPDTPIAGGNTDPVADGPRPTGDTYILDAQNGDGSQLFYNIHTTQSNWPDHVAVSAAYNTRQVYDYYLNKFGRNSIDDNGKNLMVVIHFENNFDNAFWNGTFMVYGDGGNVFSPLVGCLDVAAHEMTHGVIETSAGLIYENQSGALNESFADVFGAMIDSNDWLMGENCTQINPFYLRSLANPADGLGAGQPTHMDEYQNLPNTPDGDNGGVHINSGIPNRAAYLIAEGLSAEGLGTSIGRADTEQIYYLALTSYLTQSSQFVDARRALIQAAEDLYGQDSTQAQAVAAAFDAVGVTDGGATPPPTPTPTPTAPVAGDDVMVYLYPFDGGHELPPPNQSLERFDLYTQTIDGVVAGPYNDPLHSDFPAYYTKPAVVTTQSGTYYLYVATDFNVYEAVFGDTDYQLSQSGDIYSIAISPNNRFIAYTSIFEDDNNIYVVDFDNGGTTTSYPIVSENYQGDGTTIGNTVLYADALAFDYTSNMIVFDALNCLSTPDSLCSNGAGYRYWSIGVLNLVTGQFYFPIANQSPEIDLGYPSFAANNNYVIALDFQDYANFDTLNEIDSELITINFETQQVNFGVYDFGIASTPFYSIPSFWGDDDFITTQVPAVTPQTGNISASRLPIDSNWQSTSGPQPITNTAVALPIMHRAGVRTLTGVLTPNTTLMDFGEVPQGQSSQLELTLSNFGNNDVNIFNIETTNNNFHHNGINTRVPQNQAITILVTYSASQGGTHTGNLVIQSDSQEGPLEVSLVASTPVNNDGGNDSGGGSAYELILILLFGVLVMGSSMFRRHGIYQQ